MDAAQDRIGSETQVPGSEAGAGVVTEGIEEGQEIDFVTMGMFIIDEIEYPPPRPPAVDVLGGAGTYSALGARLFSPPPLSRTVGWIVDQGSDFPGPLTSLIASWETSALLRLDDTRLTTRGWNGYDNPSDPSHRSFRYTTPKKRLIASDLSGTPLLQARAIHLICSPNRCRELVPSIISQRKAESPGTAYTRPLFIWEPVPDLCTPDELLNCTNALPLVDICSPNHAELAGFMGCTGLDPLTNEIDTAQVERACEQLLASMPLQSYTLVVRTGPKGCYVARNGGRKRTTPSSNPAKGQPKKKKEYIRGGLQPDTDMFSLFAGLMQDSEGHVAREEIEVDPGIEKWFPAYFGEEEAKGKVVDPTGGGNTFLGGLAVALARGKGVEEACAWGNVAASFAIEQVGMPVLGRGEGGEEVWNGAVVEERLRGYLERV
ncbi:Ribokinase-like protein [Cercophora newfieldiana]|uniref:Ribokinase-like protein n=1 Tax=Cercophora newfieldiana TaxID=92897 RepID=A0AA40CP55_9PEZI|nr:Ribokinase-like protein [Cercophora newfieldiana]